MSHRPPVTHRDPEQSLRLTQCLEQFEQAWQAEGAPSLANFLPPPAANPESHALRRELLIELIMTDLEYRWRQRHPINPRNARDALSEKVSAGVQSGPLDTSASHESRPTCPEDLPPQPCLEDYLQRFPWLGGSEELPVALIVEEYRVRRRWGAVPTVADYLRRFPAQEAELERKLAALSDSQESSDPPRASSGSAPPVAALADPVAGWADWKKIAERYLADCHGPPPRPAIHEYLPERPKALRRWLLVELIKIDLADRWGRGEAPLRVEDYCQAYPELLQGAGTTPPCDLLYEEFVARRGAADPVAPAEYYERFPHAAESLRRLFNAALTRSSATTFVYQKGRPKLNLGDRIDDFDLIRPLGEGAFASVYLARQRSMQRLVALKVSAPRGEEPQTLAQLDHPNIVRVFDQRTVVEQGLRLLYMEYVSGGTLHDVVQQVRRTAPELRSGALLWEVIERVAGAEAGNAPHLAVARQFWSRRPWSDAVCWLGAQLGTALCYAHQKGVLHRDLKPANVLLASDGTPKLADFNIAYSSKLEGASPAAFFGGSLAYMSPEQMEACNPDHHREPDELDPRSDLFSLGVLLWELIDGQRPFADGEPNEDWQSTLHVMTERRRRGIATEALARWPTTAPDGLQEILQRCLAATPEERFNNGEDLARQLHWCLQPNVQRLMRPTPGSWLSYVRRNPLIASALVGVLPSVILSAVSVMYDWESMVRFLAPVDSRWAFAQVLAAIKLLLYATGLAIGIWKGLPVFRSVQHLAPHEDIESVRWWSLRMGDLAFWINLAAWAVSGIIIPLGLELHPQGDPLHFTTYAHFFLAHLLCGTIAGTFAYFLLFFFGVRVFYPRLLAAGTNYQPIPLDLEPLRNRLSRMVAVAFAVPFVAMFAISFADLEFQWAYGAMTILSGIVIAMAHRLTQSIRTDLDALADVAEQTNERTISSHAFRHR